MGLHAWFIVKIDCKYKGCFYLFCLILNPVSMVVLITKIPLDTMALTAMDWIEPNAIVWTVEVKDIKETTDCDF